MKPVLLWGLLAALGMSAYVAMQPEDEVEVAARGGGPQGGAERGAESGPDARSARAQAGAGLPATRPPVAASQPSSPAQTLQAQRLAWAHQAWQQRVTEGSHWPALDARTRTAWGSQMPPPPPPPPPMKAEPPPPPMAPPFPHRWVGRYVDTAPQAVITSASNTWVVKAQDVIDGQWRVDAVTDNQLRLTYLPLQQSQTVSMKP